MSASRDGGCLCGAVRYRASGEPLSVTHCHCEPCRKHGGVPFQTWVSFPAAAVAWVTARPTVFRSSAAAERGFCNRCGTPLTLAWRDHPERLSVTLGSLDAPDTIRPHSHRFERARLPWIKLADGLPRRPD